MVLCRFFQQGNCRFGSKCHNEHFDLKQILKTDVDAAINGKQWPFTSYGPFKDKPSIPNFVDDQSFEEVRFLCYEAKKQNMFEQFHRQFTKEAIDTTNKIKMLVHNTALLEVVANLYDTPDPSKATNNPNPINNNPFLTTNNSTNNSSSIFNKPVGNGFVGAVSFQTQQQQTNAGSIFGGAIAQPSVFGQQQNSIFGQQTMQPQQQQQSVGSIFGQAPQVGNTIFAQAIQQQQPQQNQAGSGFGLFAQAAQPPQGLFAQAAQSTSNPFVKPSAVGGNSIFAQNTQAPSQGNMFAQNVQATQPPNGFFASAATQAPPAFQTQPQPQQVFGMNTFGPNSFPQQQQPQFGNQPAQIDYSIYSRMEDLTPDEINAFKAPQFEPGKLPVSPPAFEFIN